MGLVIIVWSLAIFGLLLWMWAPPAEDPTAPDTEVMPQQKAEPAQAFRSMNRVRSRGLSIATKLRLFGAGVLLFNLWLIGEYELTGIPVLLLTFGFAFAYEFIVVRALTKKVYQ